MPVHLPVRLRFLILVAAIELCLIGWPVEPLSSIGIRGPGRRSPGSQLTLTIIRHNHARNRFGPGSGRQKPGARGMRNEAIYLFVFIGLNKAGATSAGMRSQPFGSLARDVLYIGRRSGFIREPGLSHSRLRRCLHVPVRSDISTSMYKKAPSTGH
jgi:hypothetical protein